MIELSHVFAGYGDTPILQDITLTVPAGAVTAIIGPNGCGKTTLLRCLSGQLPCTEGSITVFGKPLPQYGRKELAKTLAILPQTRDVPALTVEAMVQHGRYPHLGFHRQLTSADQAAVRRAMAQADVADLAKKPLRELSGGQRQRAYIAMALAQDTPIILLDEPTTHLDLNRQFELLALIRQLQKAGKTVVMVLHDLDHALRFSDRVILLNAGRLVQAGTPEDLLQSGKIADIFDITIHQADAGYLFSPAETCNY